VFSVCAYQYVNVCSSDILYILHIMPTSDSANPTVMFTVLCLFTMQLKLLSSFLFSASCYSSTLLKKFTGTLLECTSVHTNVLCTLTYKCVPTWLVTLYLVSKFCVEEWQDICNCCLGNKFLCAVYPTVDSA